MGIGKRYHTDQTHFLRKAVTSDDDGSTVTVGTLPAGAIVIAAGVIVATAFDGTTPVLDIGTPGDGNGLGSAISLGTVGRIEADDFATSDDLYSASEVTVTADASTTGNNSTAGEAFVYVEYLPQDPDPSVS